MLSLPIKPIEVADRSGLTDEGLYHVQSEDLLVLMRWENNQLRMSGFTSVGNFGSFPTQDAFVSQWFKDCGIEVAPTLDVEASDAQA